MIRKFFALSVALLLSLLVLPVLPASAVTGVASLVAGAEVFPGAGRGFSIEVTNADPNALLGGQTVNNVEVILPTGAGLRASSATVAPSGWTVVVVNRSGGQQAYQFRGPSAGGIAPGAKLAFPFVADVVAPASSDKSGTFQVLLSTDRGVTQSDAPGTNLTTKVRVLEVVDGSLKALGSADGNAGNDALVADGSATSGQTITYGVQVRNYALNALTLAPALSSNGGDTVTNPAAVSVPGNGGVTNFVHTVALAAGQTSDRTATFTAKAATATAAARDKTAPYTVQAPASLALTGSSFTPKNHRPGTATAFTIGAQKQRTPGLSGLSGDLSFLTNSADLTGVSESASTPAGSSIGTGAKTVTFSYESINVTGADGKHDVAFTFAATDTNGFPFAQSVALDDLINLDSLAPKLELTVNLPVDADGAKQTAAKNGDTITVTGKVDVCNDATGLVVQLVPNAGSAIPVPVTRSTDGCTFSGSVKPTFAAGATSFNGSASATDLAGNPGDVTAAATVVDNVLPVVSSAQTLDASLFPTMNPPTGATTKVEVALEETNGAIRGGCNPTQWQIAGEQLAVYRVLYSDGTACTASQAGPDDVRILVLTTKKDVDWEGKVTYTPGTRPGQDPIKDDAAGETLTFAKDIVTGVRPLAPVLSKGLRNTAQGATPETATFDEGTYWTRFTGQDFVLEFTGGRSGYSVQVLDAAGNVLKTAPATTATSEVVVPVGGTDGAYPRAIQLVNGRNLISTQVPFTVTVDRVNPALAGSTLNATRTSVAVTFSEKLWEGTNHSQDWKVWTNNPNYEVGDDEGNKRLYYGVGSVSGTQTASRTLNLAKALPAGETYGAAEYALLSETGKRYLDRAGNTLGDI